MPTISMFYGIIVSMFFEIHDKHHLPHVHVRYQGMKASIAIEDGALLAGEISGPTVSHGAGVERSAPG